MKHKNVEEVSQSKPELDIDVLKELILEAKQALSEDLCYPEKLRTVISNYNNIDTASSNLYSEIQKLYNDLVKNGDAEQYFKHYYANIIFCSDLLFENIGKPYSTLLAKKLGDKILAFFKNPPKCDPIVKPLEISQRELGSLQYLSGYVVRKVLKKTKNHKNYKSEESQAIIAVLQAMTTMEFKDQRLIQTKDRGGLTALNFNTQSIFRIIEEEYRIETSSDHLRKIDSQAITLNLMKNVDIISIYNNIVESTGIKCNEELSENLLEKLIALYLRVRAFSTAKDITNKHWVAQKKQKTKGLRKSIKKASEKELVI